MITATPTLGASRLRSGWLRHSILSLGWTGPSWTKAEKPGNHRIYSTDKSTGIDLAAKPGETYYVRVDILVGFWKGHGGVTLVDPQQGKYELGQVTH